MQRGLTFNASMHSDAAGRRKYEQDETAPAPLALLARSLAFPVILIPFYSSAETSCNILQGDEPRVNTPVLPMARGRLSPFS